MRDPGDLARLALFSIFGIVINQVCFIEGLARTTPTHSSLIVTTIPVWTLILAVLLGKERLRPRKAIASVVAFVGVLLVIRPGWGTVSAESLLGDTLTLINAASFALFLVISRPLLARLDPLVATTALFAFGSLAMAVVGLPELLTVTPASVSSHIWWLGAFIVLMPTVGAYVIQAWALARVESSVVAFFIFLQPVIATGLSVTLLHERPGWPVLVGALLIFAGVGITLSRSRSGRRNAGDDATDQGTGSPG